MKKILVLVLLTGWIISCNKEKDKENHERHCPIVVESAVPQIVKDSFAVKYSGISVITWFQKDSIGYCAYFIVPVNQSKMATFTSTGIFISEEYDMEHEGEHEDSLSHTTPKDSTGTCICEIPD